MLWTNLYKLALCGKQRHFWTLGLDANLVRKNVNRDESLHFLESSRTSEE